MSYPFANRTMITQAEAVDFIRKIVFTGQSKKLAGNSIRQRISRAEQTSRLKRNKKSGPIQFNALLFFQWAVVQWPKLKKNLKGMPRAVQVEDIVDTPKISDSATPLVIPTNPARLRKLYIKACLRLDVLEPEVVQLSAENKALREQVKALQDKDAERRKNCGHRGNF